MEDKVIDFDNKFYSKIGKAFSTENANFAEYGMMTD